MKKASTFRLQSDVQSGLDLVSKLQHRPKNKLVNEAVAEYVSRYARQTEEAVQETLKALQSYQRTDPDFAHAIEAFVDAEAKLGRHQDPAEGDCAPQNGPVSQAVRKLINA